MSRKFSQSLCTSLRSDYIEHYLLHFYSLGAKRYVYLAQYFRRNYISVCSNEIRASHLGKIRVSRVKTQIKIC